MIRVTFLLILSSLAFPALSQDRSACSDVDIREGMNSEMRQYFSHPRDQRNIGWCYAFTGADLLTAETGQPVSVTHVAANHNQAVRRDPFSRSFRGLIDLFSGQDLSANGFLEGGYVRQTLLRNMDYGFVCSEEAIPYETENQQSAMEHIRFLIDLQEFIRARVGQSVNLNDCHAFAYQREINPLIPDDLQMMANQLASNHVDEYLANLAAGACPESARIAIEDQRVLKRNNPRTNSPRRSEGQLNNRDSRWLGELGEALSSGKPVGLEYNVFLFMEKEEGYGAHASTIIARRWHEGRCQYKIRNSWGQGCSTYRHDIAENLCNAEEGAFWVSDQELLESATNYSYIP